VTKEEQVSSNYGSLELNECNGALSVSMMSMAAKIYM